MNNGLQFSPWVPGSSFSVLSIHSTLELTWHIRHCREMISVRFCLDPLSAGMSLSPKSYSALDVYNKKSPVRSVPKRVSCAQQPGRNNWRMNWRGSMLNSPYASVAEVPDVHPVCRQHNMEEGQRQSFVRFHRQRVSQPQFNTISCRSNRMQTKNGRKIYADREKRTVSGKRRGEKGDAAWG